MESRSTHPATGPIVIAADSTDEALAFLAQLFSEAGGENLRDYRTRVMVFDVPASFPIRGRKSEIHPVAFTREVETSACALRDTMHCIATIRATPRPADRTSHGSRRRRRRCGRAWRRWGRVATRFDD